MEPKSGALLAIAQYPFFNPNAYRKFKSANWRNRAITDSIEPGSTLKIFSATAAIESPEAAGPDCGRSTQAEAPWTSAAGAT